MVSNKAKKIDIKSLLFSLFITVLSLSTIFCCAKENKIINKKNKPSMIIAQENKTLAKPEVKSDKIIKKDTKKTSLKQKAKQDKKTKKEKTEKKKHKAFRDLDYDELKVSKEKLLKEGKKDVAIKHIEKMIPLCDNIQELRDLSLEISDLLFDEGELKKAETLYSNFCQSYPGDKNIEYANYKSILCNYWLTLDKERDQSSTKNTINLAKSFLDRSEIFKQYSEDVEKILADCQNKLLESDISIFKEYLNLGDQLSAKTRLACIEKDFSDHIPNLEPKMLALSCEYAQVFNDQNLLDAKQKELNSKFPEWKDEPIILADNKKIGKTKDQKSFLDKF